MKPVSLLPLYTLIVLAARPIDGRIRIHKPKHTVHFLEAPLTTAIDSAVIQHRFIFLDAYASWCGPCRQLKTQTFTNPEVAAFFNTHFINLSMDMGKKEGLALAEKLHLRMYPTLYFLNTKGQVVAYSEGYLPPAQLLAYAHSVLARFGSTPN